MKTLVLVDGNSLQWRAAFSSAGIDNDGVVKTLFSYFAKLDSKFTPECIVAFWDTGPSRWRKEAFSGYKEARAKKEKDIDVEEVFEQVKLTKRLLGHYGIQSVSVKGVEADDLIALYTSYSYNLFERICIVTTDKDLWQLISDKVEVYNHLNDQVINKHYLKNNYVDSYKIPYLKALSGDPSDSIPGIKGIGEKGAIKLIEDYKIDSEFNIRPYKEHFGKIKKTSRILDTFEVFETCYRLVSLSQNSDIAYMFNQEELNELVSKLAYPDTNKKMVEDFQELLGDYSETPLTMKSYDYSKFYGIVDLFKVPEEGSSCRSCSRFTSCSGGGNIHIGSNMKVLFVTDRPFYGEDGSVKYFNEEEGEEFNRILEDLGLGGSEVGLIGSVNCGTGFIKEPELRCCTDKFLKPIIEYYKPEWIVCFGIEAFYILTGISGDSTKLAGQVSGNVLCLPKIRDRLLSELVRIQFDYGLENFKGKLRGEILE